MHKRNTTIRGFTIVELLIVVVVIAILAAISLVAYTNIQRRASNTQTVAAVAQTLKTIAIYKALHDELPLEVNGEFCLIPGETGTCSFGSIRAVNATLINNLNSVGALPTSIPDNRPNHLGINYSYVETGRTVNGAPHHAVIRYTLRGEGVDCGVPNILMVSVWDTFTTSTTKNSYYGAGYTTCFVAVP